MPSPLNQINSPKIRKSKSSFSAFSFSLWLIKIIILSSSLSLLAGTILTVLKPINSSVSSSSSKNAPEPTKSPTPIVTHSAIPVATASIDTGLPLKKELASLQQEILSLAKQTPQLKPYVLFDDLDNGNYVAIDSTKKIAAASTIKTFVCYAFFQDVDAGKIDLSQKLTMTKEDMADGSGNMQYQKPDTQFTALETVTKMITISDNTATNMLIRLLGGNEAVNKRIASWGMSSTYIQSPLPDLKGTNKTTTQDLALLLLKMNRGDLLTPQSRNQMLIIMQQTKTRTLLPPGLDAKSIIAHKTGDIGTILGDAGIINTPNGQHYIGVAFVERPYNDVGGRILIQKISKIMSQGFKNAATKSNN